MPRINYGPADAGGGTGNEDFVSTLHESVRGHEGLKGVKDANELATRYVREISTPFAERLPKEIAGDAAFRDIKDLPALAKSYLAAHKMVGLDKGKVLRIPASADDKEGYAALYKALGVPDAEDGYQIPETATKKLKNGEKFNDKFVAWARKTARELGVPQTAFGGLLSSYMDYAAQDALERGESEKTARKQAIDAFKAELGGEEASKTKLELAQATLMHLARDAGVDQKTIADLNPESLAALPWFTKILLKLGGNLQEDGLLGKGGEGGYSDELSPAEAKQQIAAKQGDKDFMRRYRSKKEAGHDEAVQEMARLFELAQPQGDEDADWRANPGGGRQRAADSRRRGTRGR